MGIDYFEQTIEVAECKDDIISLFTSGLPVSTILLREVCRRFFLKFPLK